MALKTIENYNPNLFGCKEEFLLQALKAEISGSLRILCISPLMYFKGRYSTRILMFDPFFKLTEIRSIMMLSECKYLIQTSSRRWNHIDSVFLIFTTLSFVWLKCESSLLWFLEFSFHLCWMTWLTRTVIYVTQFLSLFLSPHWNTVSFVS